jgi:hypothetical protein
MTEIASTSEMSVNFYQTTRRQNPEDNHRHTRRRENLKFHSGIQIFTEITTSTQAASKDLQVFIIPATQLARGYGHITTAKAVVFKVA